MLQFASWSSQIHELGSFSLKLDWETHCRSSLSIFHLVKGICSIKLD